MTESRSPQVPAFAKVMMRFQAFLLRRNWMGRLGKEIMVINVTGRKSGKQYATPIGYLPDAEAPGGTTIVALTNAQNPSNWYHNALSVPEVTLEINGKPLRAKAQKVTDPVERQRIFALYRRERAANFVRLFGVSAEASEGNLQKALETRRFVRFVPTN